MGLTHTTVPPNRPLPADASAGIADMPAVGTWGTPPTAPELPQQLAISHVLDSWRAAERRLDGLVEASPLRTLTLSEVARLRAEYQRLFARALR